MSQPIMNALDAVAGSQASAYITLSDLRAGGGRLYYGSIASGKDEAHCYDLTTRREFRITTSAYGSFDPAPAGGEGLMRVLGSSCKPEPLLGRAFHLYVI